MTVLTLQFAFRVIKVHQISNRSSVFGVLVQAPQLLSNIHSDTSVLENQQAPWVLILKEEKQNTKTLQNSLAKAPKMQRIKIPFLTEERESRFRQKTHESKVKWKAGVY